MNSKLSFVLVFIFCILNLNAQTEGRDYVKSQLTASGVYEAPAFEYTTAYDEYIKGTSDGTIRGLFMEGLPYSKALNDEQKTKIFCWYGEPNGLAEGQKVPAVILVHGGGGQAFSEWVDKWVSEGYIAIALSLINKLPDGTKSTTYASPQQQMFFLDNNEAIQDQWFYHAIGDAMLAHSLLCSSTLTDHVDTAHIGVTGISWGGINNTVLAGIDERLDFAIPVYGCAYLKDSPVYSNQYRRMSDEAKACYDANWRGELYTPYHHCPMLFVDSNKDLQFTLNIFDRTYDDSASPEKYLRIENSMGHGHGAGRRPREIYDFADYVTGYRSAALKPLAFTSHSIGDDDKVSYTFNYEGAVDSALLYYTRDTLTWGKRDENFIWLTKPAVLEYDGTTGTVSTTVPDDAQVYYVNVKNTPTRGIFSSTMKYRNRYYTWSDYGTGVINTPVGSPKGGVLATNVTNPKMDAVNSNAEANSFTKVSGEGASVVFELSTKIEDLSQLKNKLNVYLENDLNAVPNATIQLTYYNSVIGESAQVSASDTILASGAWDNYSFDFTSEIIPASVNAAGGFDRVKLCFSPEDITTDGTVYYLDDLKGTSLQVYVKPLTYYPWLDFSVSPVVLGITKHHHAGGDYVSNYDMTLDNIPRPTPGTKLATKFTKEAGADKHAQIAYDFTDGILDADTVVFKVRAFFKPETVYEINTFEPGCTGISLSLKSASEGENIEVTETAYFTVTNQWEELTFTFIRSDLHLFNQMVLTFANTYASPIDENGIELVNEDFVYYIDYIKSTSDVK